MTDNDNKKTKELKFVSRISRMGSYRDGKSRKIVSVPQKYYEEASKLKGKTLRVTLEEILLE